MKEKVNIKIIDRYLINPLGSFLMIFGFIFLLTYFVFSIPYYHLPFNQTPIELHILLLISFLTIIIGFIFYKMRRCKNAKISFDAKSLNIISKKQNVTIKFEEIKKFSSTDINAKLDKISFKIITKDSLTYEIKADEEIYEGLIALFPDKG